MSHDRFEESVVTFEPFVIDCDQAKFDIVDRYWAKVDVIDRDRGKVDVICDLPKVDVFENITNIFNKLTR